MRVTMAQRVTTSVVCVYVPLAGEDCTVTALVPPVTMVLTARGCASVTAGCAVTLSLALANVPLAGLGEDAVNPALDISGVPTVFRWAT